MNVTRLHQPDAEWNCRIGRVWPRKSDNVVPLSVMTSLDVEPSRILAAAMEHGMSQSIVIGYDTDGEFYFSSSAADGGTILWLMEVAKRRLLNVAASISEHGPTAA